MINTSFPAAELASFANLRLPSEAAAELCNSDRWMLCMYSSGAPPGGPIAALPPAADLNGIHHDLHGWYVVGTVSLSLEREGTVETHGNGVAEGPLRDGGPREWHVHLLGINLTMGKLGLGARLLEAAEEFVTGHSAQGECETLVAYGIVEFGKAEYYERRGFTEVGERIPMAKGQWGSKIPFTLARMVKIVGGTNVGN